MCYDEKKIMNISLGRNCEVAFAFASHGFKLESSLLNWSFIRSDKQLFLALSSPEIVFMDDYKQVASNMFECANLEIFFHSKEVFTDWKNLEMNDPKILSAMSELRSRSQHLASKLRSQLSGPHRINAFVKPPRLKRGGIYEFCRDLRSLIDEKYPNNDVNLFVVLEGDRKPLKQFDDLQRVYKGFVSEYTLDSKAKTFSSKASDDWKALIASSEVI